jgi:hypothetical protein
MPNQCQRICYLSLLVLFVFLSPSVSSTPASPLTRPLTFVWNSSVDRPNPLRIHCVGEDSWISPDHSTLNDCGEAVDRLYLTDYGRSLGRNFQFVAANTPPHPRFPHTASTPRRYTIGTCTVAVVMLTDFPSSQPFPGKPPAPYPQWDIASFQKVWAAAVRILRACVMGHTYGGYEIIGRDDGIGVFIWSTGSETDRAVGAGQ